jgi:hypothetical protein
LKGEVYGKRSFPLAGMDKKQAGGKGGDLSWKSNFNKGGKPDALKESNFKLKKMLQPKRTKTVVQKKGKMKGTLEEGMNF